MRPLLARILDWLRAGYPTGIPERDYVPILALLRRRLPDDEVETLGIELVNMGLVPATRVDVGVGLTKLINELPSPSEMDRVSARLRDTGWPIDLDDESPLQ